MSNWFKKFLYLARTVLLHGNWEEERTPACWVLACACAQVRTGAEWFSKGRSYFFALTVPGLASIFCKKDFAFYRRPCVYTVVVHILKCRRQCSAGRRGEARAVFKLSCCCSLPLIDENLLLLKSAVTAVTTLYTILRVGFSFPARLSSLYSFSRLCWGPFMYDVCYFGSLGLPKFLKEKWMAWFGLNWVGKYLGG